MNSGRKRVSVDEQWTNDASLFRECTRRKINYEERGEERGDCQDGNQICHPRVPPCDTIFECKDGKQIFQSRVPLMSRWPWFHSISITGDAHVMWVPPCWLKVFLPDMTSSTLLLMLEFLFTGKTPHLNYIQAVDVIRACKSRYFQLPKFEDTAMTFLETSLSRTHDVAFSAALELSLAEFRTTAALEAPTIRALYCMRLRPRQFRGLSENALRHYLDNTKSTTFFGEYLRFRQIIVWCATQACPDEADDIIEAFVPDQRQLITYVWIAPSRRTESNCFNFHEVVSRLEDYQRCAAGLLEKVNFVHIPSEILNAGVEPLVTPLRLVSEERLKESYTKAYRFQALKGTPKPSQYVWEHGNSYRTGGDGDGLVITKVMPELGMARFPTPIFRDYGVYEWAILIERPCKGFCEIGFVVERMREEPGLWGHRPGYRKTVSGNYNGFCLKITPLTARTNKTGDACEPWADFMKDFQRLYARVKFRLDLNKHACFIAINDDGYRLAWDGLPSDVLYYPVVSLGTTAGGGGQVRIQLTKGFGIA